MGNHQINNYHRNLTKDIIPVVNNELTRKGTIDSLRTVHFAKCCMQQMHLLGVKSIPSDAGCKWKIVGDDSCGLFFLLILMLNTFEIKVGRRVYIDKL